jgi:imidazolonepropionase-like amidohydrolase
MKKAIINSHVYDSKLGSFQPDTTILWQDGVILEVGQHLEVPSDAEIIDGKGCFVTPGLIDTFTQLGLRESGVRWEGDDSHEVADSNQVLLSVIDGIYPFDQGFEEARANGVTTVHVAPGPENVISGQTAIIKTKGNVIDDMVVQARYGLAVSFGEIPKRLRREAFQSPLTRMGVAALLREQLRNIQFSKDRNEEDERNALLHKVLQKEAPLFVRAHRADDIMTALRFKEEFSIELVLVHATEANQIVDKIAESKVPVFAGPFFQDRSRYELKRLDPSTSMHLHQAGVPFSLITDHPTSAIRNIGLEVVLAIREGMEKSDAIHSLTLGAAKLLGIDSKLGSIETGKEADIVVWDDEPFELLTRVNRTFIHGEEVFTKGGEGK